MRKGRGVRILAVLKWAQLYNYKMRVVGEERNVRERCGGRLGEREGEGEKEGERERVRERVEMEGG